MRFGIVERVDRLLNWLEGLAQSPRRATLLRLALCLLVYVPGVLMLPAVDRTEVMFAETTRAMVERGNWLDPKYGETVHQFRPIGTFWAQGATRAVAGEAAARDIRIYRIPGLIAVTLAVLALFWMARPLVGAAPALLASGFFAVAPLTVLLSQLAIADGLALLPATLAMLALLRIYTGRKEADTRRLALLFWVAMGFGMVINALHTPILVATTLIALFAFDRDLAWLKRLHAPWGVPLALLLAAPWLYVRAHQDGVPFAGMEWGEFLAALGGAQDMKLRAFPGTFVLAAVLGFLPATALLAPALKRLWDGRDAPVARFLFAWIAGYIIYLELVSSKPGTYMVQVMFPAMALAVAMLVFEKDKAAAPPRWHAIPWPPLAAVFALALLGAPLVLFKVVPGIIAVVLGLAVAALFFLSAQAGRAGNLKAWAVSGVAALALFAVTLLGAVLPSIDKIWPARQIQTALAGCQSGPVAVLGFREPSAGFVLAPDARAAETDAVRSALVEGRASYIVGEARDETVRRLNRMQYRRMSPLACVQAYNVMRGCPLYFTIVATGDTAACQNRERFPCTAAFNDAARASRSSKTCD